MGIYASAGIFLGNNLILTFDDEYGRLNLQLAARGHEIEIFLQPDTFGRGQIILRLDNGVLVGGTESRTDSNIACW